MKSKTSFFNKTVFKKNLTRFAPVMAVYTLCLILGMMMLYQINEEMGRTFWFASRIAGNLQLMGLVNLLFAPLVAMLLFGDLYNSRMCNALHAMPMRRETLFLTNVVSGLLFSMIPTAVMALLSVPLLKPPLWKTRGRSRFYGTSAPTCNSSPSSAWRFSACSAPVTALPWRWCTRC